MTDVLERITSLETENASLRDALEDARTRIARMDDTASHVAVARIDVALGAIKAEEMATCAILSAWRQRLSRHKTETERALRQAVQSHNTAIRLQKSDADQSDERRRDAAEYTLRRAQEVEEITAKLRRIENITDRLARDPLSLFLPIGTIVTVGKVRDDLMGKPDPGQTGVVIGYAIHGHRPNLVAFAQDVREGKYILSFDEDQPPQFTYPVDELEVVSHSKLVGGEVNRRIGYVPTHEHDEPKSILHGTDMLFEALGRTWRVQEINGIPELTQNNADTEYFLSWMKPIKGDQS